ncbi:MAG: hypothetical protein GXO47_10925 [Chlorobi bacterium]|nr:hypothetical protein [Chlorobiota bacterium]
MTKQIVFFILIITSSMLYSQNKDYVILRQTETTMSDTITGEIVFPKNGIITKVKITSNNELKKYTPDKAIGFKYGERYFASVPYNQRTKVFAERVVNGKIELYFYDSSPKGSYGGLAGAVSSSLTSYYFIKKSNNDFIKVPHSREKAQNEIADLFSDNEKIHNTVLSDKFRVWKLPEIVTEYNKE